MSRLLLVRHGVTEYNSARMFLGHRDIGLSALGQRQIEKLGRQLAAEKIDAVYSSDLKRAVVTARAIATGHGLGVTTCPELREISYGKVEGLTFEEIKCQYPDVAELCTTWSPQLVFPEGESFEELKHRVNSFVERLKPHTPEETVLVVAHAGPLRLLICFLLGLELQHWRQFFIDPASVSIVYTYPQTAILTLLNDTSHLREAPLREAK